jgi:DUF971 family protein
MSVSKRPWPTELRLLPGGHSLAVSFDDGSNATLEAEYLRVESPSAEVQGHGAGQKKLVTDKEAITITEVEPVGNYAIRLTFDDGHDSGLFTWDYLHKLSEEKAQKRADYAALITANGAGDS